MVNMKTDENDDVEYKPNPYGYGLCLDIDEDRCELLGIKTPLPAGTKVKITAIATVIRSTSSVDTDDEGETDVCMTLQITDMELGKASAGADAKGLYPNSEMK